MATWCVASALRAWLHSVWLLRKAPSVCPSTQAWTMGAGNGTPSCWSCSGCTVAASAEWACNSHAAPLAECRLQNARQRAHTVTRAAHQAHAPVKVDGGWQATPAFRDCVERGGRLFDIFLFRDRGSTHQFHGPGSSRLLKGTPTLAPADNKTLVDASWQVNQCGPPTVFLSCRATHCRAALRCWARGL